MNRCEWCVTNIECCGTCKRFFDGATGCATDPGELKCIAYEPFRSCPKCGRKIKEQIDNAFAALLHRRECLYFPACLSNDCTECLKIHMEKGGEKDG